MKRSAAWPWLAAIAALLPVAAAAHPHGWVDVRVEVLFDGQGRVAGLRETWLFDDYYSAYAVEGMDEDGDGAPDPARLRALLKENMTNLAEYDYFTRVTVDDGNLAFGEPGGMSSHMEGNRLEMTFELPLAEPQRPPAGGLVYAVYDPTYYIEMLHAESDDAIRLIGAPTGCGASLEEPNPSLETVTLAASLDRMQTATDGLGALFAQRVTVRCD